MQNDVEDSCSRQIVAPAKMSTMLRSIDIFGPDVAPTTEETLRLLWQKTEERVGIDLDPANSSYAGARFLPVHRGVSTRSVRKTYIVPGH
jgi:hypothetical protein